MYYEQKIKGYVGGVESGVCGCIQSNVTHVGGVESERFHVLCEKFKMTLHIFAHNFLNIQWIFNLKKVLES